MGLLVTIQNHRSAAYPVDERSYVWAQGQPQMGEQIHLHDQSRLVRVDHVVWMAQEVPYDDGYGKRLASRACVAVVTGTDPNLPSAVFDGRYS